MSNKTKETTQQKADATLMKDREMAHIELSAEMREAVEAMNRFRSVRLGTRVAELPKCHYIRTV